MFKKIIYGSFIAYFMFSIICGTILYSGLVRYRQQSEYYRIEYERASNQQQLLTATIDKCWESTKRTKELLGSSINSVGELREQLKAVEADYNRLYSLCFDNGSNVYNGKKQVKGEQND